MSVVLVGSSACQGVRLQVSASALDAQERAALEGQGGGEKATGRSRDRRVRGGREQEHI